MVSKEEAEATFRTLVQRAEVVAGIIPATGRNYKLIIAVVLILVLLIGIGAWWWFQGKKVKPAYVGTPAIARGNSTRLTANGIPGSK